MARKKSPPSEALFEQEDLEIYGSSMAKVEKKDPHRKTLTPRYMSECLQGDVIEHEGVMKMLCAFMTGDAVVRDKDDSRPSGYGESYLIPNPSKAPVTLVEMAKVRRKGTGRDA